MATNDDYGASAAAAGTLVLGPGVTGIFESAQDHDWFRVTLEAQTTYQFVLSSLGNWAKDLTLAPTLQLVDASGSSYGAVSVGTGALPTLWYKPSQGGTYYIDVYGSAALGGYQLAAQALAHDDYADGRDTTATLAPGGKVSGSIDVGGDRDAFAVTLEAGVTYQFDAAGVAGGAGGAAAATVQLYQYGTYGWTTVGSSRYGSYAGSQGYTATASGTYYVVVGDADPVKGTGNYQLTMSTPADDYTAHASGAGLLAVGGKVSGQLERSADLDWFKVSLQANQNYEILITGGAEASSFYSYFSIVDQLGNSLAYAHPLSDGSIVINWAPPRSGDYYVQAGNGLSPVAAYTVQLALSAKDDYSADVKTTGQLAAGAALQGSLEVAGDVDWVKVHLDAGASYTFGLSAGTLSNGKSVALSSMELLDAKGKLVQSAQALPSGGGQAVTYQATESADYYLSVRAAWDQAKVSYTLTSYPTLPDAVAGNSSTLATIKPGSAVKGEFEFVGDRDWYKMELSAGTYYYFNLLGVKNDGGTFDFTQGGVTVRVVDASGKAMDYNSSVYTSDPSISYYHSGPSGTYYLQLGTVGINTGSYTLLAGTSQEPAPDRMAPKVSSVSGPSSAAKGLGADLSVAFSETIKLGTGTIKLSLASGELVESFDAAGGHLSANGSVLSINPSLDLLPDTDYVIEFGPGSVRDTAGNASSQTQTLSLHTAGADRVLTGTGGNDVFKLGTGNDTVYGGDGVDTAILPGYWYFVTSGPAYIAASDYRTSTVHTLVSVERVLLGNSKAYAFDVDGAAGQVYRLYRAAFDRSPDESGMGYWLAQSDKGMSLHDIAASFVASKEFQALYGLAPNDAEFVTALYSNVLDRQPDQAGLAYWTGELAHGLARADVLAAFSESPENQLAITVSGLSGIQYIPYF